MDASSRSTGQTSPTTGLLTSSSMSTPSTINHAFHHHNPRAPRLRIFIRKGDHRRWRRLRPIPFVLWLRSCVHRLICLRFGIRGISPLCSFDRFDSSSLLGIHSLRYRRLIPTTKRQNTKVYLVATYLLKIQPITINGFTS